jgi:hypothetical protein
MNAQLIVYNLKSEEYSSVIINQIKAYSDWAKITDNCWIVITEKSSGSVRDDLRYVINGNGNILVINVTGQGWGTYAIPKSVTDWMKNKIYQ